MKKFFCSFLFLLLALLTGCASQEQPSQLRETLDLSLQSSRFVCSVAIHSDEFLLAEEVAVFDRSGDDPAFSLQRTLLNDDLTAAELYSSESFYATLSDASYEDAASLFFDETAATVSRNGDTISLTADDPDAFLCYDAGASALTASLALEYGRPVSCFISYSLPSGNSVSISFLFFY